MKYIPKHITYEEAREYALNDPKNEDKSEEYIENYIEGFMIDYDRGYELGIRKANVEMLERFENRLIPHSIFRLDIVYKNEDTQNNPTENKTHSSMIGHYSTFENAVISMVLYREEFNPDNVYAFFIKEIGVDTHQGDVSFLSIRSYTKETQRNDECLNDYNLCYAFKGRPKEQIRHKIGDIVECLYDNYLFLGIVAALPPTPEEYRPNLSAFDDSYLILPYSNDRDDHFHIPCTHVFTPTQEYDESIIHHLQKALEDRKERIITMKSVKINNATKNE